MANDSPDNWMAMIDGSGDISGSFGNIGGWIGAREAWNASQSTPGWLQPGWRDPEELWGLWWAINPFTPDDPKIGLRNLLRNPDCASLVGGQRMATALVNNLNIQTYISPIRFLAPGSPLEQEYTNYVLPGLMYGDNPAATFFGTNSMGGWNQQAIFTVTGHAFNTLSYSQQMTVLIHEIMHPALGALGNAFLHPNFTSTLDIMSRCGGAYPSGVANEIPFGF